MHTFDVHEIRSRFPGLSRMFNGQPAIFFDGPAGSQVPARVAGVVANYLTQTNANHGGPFATAVESDRILDAAQRTVADFLGTADDEGVVFGPNTTSLTFALSRALRRTFKPGDEVIVSRLDHDANVTPWVLAAVEAGAIVRHIELSADDCTLDLDDFEAKLTDRTALVAVGLASNATGTINPVRQIARRAHERGALVFVDAVHFAPHGLIDVCDLDCDFLACSAYKFFGPHVGVLWGKSAILAALPVEKLRPAPDSLPGKWMTGTQNHEGIAGTAEAVDYLASLGDGNPGKESTRRDALVGAYEKIVAYERELVTQLIGGLRTLPELRIWGITDPSCFDARVPTVSFTIEGRAPAEVARYLAEKGIFVWAGNHYALPFTDAMGLEPGGTVRIGLLHYNTHDEIERLLAALRELH